MKLDRSFSVVDSHTEGMRTRVVLGGGPKIPGETITKKRDYFRQNMDHIVKMLVREPRGPTHLAYLVPPTIDEADIGVLFGYGNMCGHATIGVVTTLVGMGMVTVKEPVTEVNLDTPAGLVRAKANVTDGSVDSVTFQNVPAFLFETRSIRVPDIGDIEVDIAFGGNFYLFMSDEKIGVKVEQKNLEELLRIGGAVLNAAETQVPNPHHPTNPSITARLGSVMICGSAVDPRASAKNILVSRHNAFDRSPCGTGTSGRMASLYAKGKLKLNEEFIHESIIGSLFKGRLIQETKVGEYTAVIPEITGSAYITGINTIISTVNDPYKNGFSAYI